MTMRLHNDEAFFYSFLKGLISTDAYNQSRTMARPLQGVQGTTVEQKTDNAMLESLLAVLAVDQLAQHRGE